MSWSGSFLHTSCRSGSVITETAETHYLRVSDSDFEQAVTEWSNNGQQGPVGLRSGSSENRQRTEKGTIRAPAQHCRDSNRASITRPGLEPGMAGPKPAVLPITPPGNVAWHQATCGGSLWKDLCADNARFGVDRGGDSWICCEDLDSITMDPE